MYYINQCIEINICFWCLSKYGFVQQTVSHQSNVSKSAIIKSKAFEKQRINIMCLSISEFEFNFKITNAEQSLMFWNQYYLINLLS